MERTCDPINLQLHDYFIAADVKTGKKVQYCYVDKEVGMDRIVANVINGRFPMWFSRATGKNEAVSWPMGGVIAEGVYEIVYTGYIPPEIRKQGYGEVIYWYEKEFVK